MSINTLSNVPAHYTRVRTASTPRFGARWNVVLQIETTEETRNKANHKQNSRQQHYTKHKSLWCFHQQRFWFVRLTSAEITGERGVRSKFNFCRSVFYNRMTSLWRQQPARRTRTLKNKRNLFTRECNAIITPYIYKVVQIDNEAFRATNVSVLIYSIAWDSRYCPCSELALLVSKE